MKSKLQSIVTSFHFSYYSTHEILTVFHLRVPFSLVVYAEDSGAQKGDTSPLPTARCGFTLTEWLPLEPGETSRRSRSRGRYFPPKDVVLSSLPVWRSVFRLYRLYRLFVLTLRRLMSYIYIYIYGAPILDVSRSHTTTQHSR